MLGRIGRLGIVLGRAGGGAGPDPIHRLEDLVGPPPGQGLRDAVADAVAETG